MVGSAIRSASRSRTWSSLAPRGVGTRFVAESGFVYVATGHRTRDVHVLVMYEWVLEPLWHVIIDDKPTDAEKVELEVALDRMLGAGLL